MELEQELALAKERLESMESDHLELAEAISPTWYELTAMQLLQMKLERVEIDIIKNLQKELPGAREQVSELESQLAKKKCDDRENRRLAGNRAAIDAAEDSEELERLVLVYNLLVDQLVKVTEKILALDKPIEVRNDRHNLVRVNRVFVPYHELDLSLKERVSQVPRLIYCQLEPDQI